MSHSSLLIAVFAISTLMVATAHADGAFPDELQVFAPHLEPSRLVLSTNYGLILSADDGATWSYVCETAVDPTLVTTYGIGPSVLYAVSSAVVLTSADDGCTWAGQDLSATGATLVTDVFGDVTLDNRAFAITFNQNNSYDLYELVNGTALDVYPSPNGILEGVEISQSNPQVTYAVTSIYATGDIDVLRSDDGGGGWLSYDHAELSAFYAGIAAVDPIDSATVYFRLSPALGGGDALGVTHDSGQTIAILFTAPGALSAFAVDVDHSWYAGDEANDFWYGAPDGGITPGTGPALRCLAARSGVVYGCGDAQTDGFILGVSTDHGVSFQPLVTTTNYQTATCAPVRAVCPVIDGGSTRDAGQTIPDAGPIFTDAGAHDAGSSLDGGAFDAGPEDAGRGIGDAGARSDLDAGRLESSTSSSSTSSGSTGDPATSRSAHGAAPGCGCTQSDAALTGVLAGVILANARGRRRRSTD